MIFNDRLKRLREEKKMTQSQVAKQCGMVIRAYQRLENEEAKPNFDSLLSFASYYNISVDWLMGRTDDRALHQPCVICVPQCCGSQEERNMVFNNRLKKLRQEKKVTQGQAAELCGMGLRAYQRLENDGAKPHFSHLMSLSNYYNVSVDWLMGRTDDREMHRL